MEEIDDVEGNSIDPFVADAIANEGDLSLTEEQRRNFRKVCHGIFCHVLSFVSLRVAFYLL